MLPSFFCPFSKRIFVDPVVAPNGVTYERETLFEKSFQGDGFIGKYLVDASNVKPNDALLKEVEAAVEVADETVKKAWQRRRNKVLARRKLDAAELLVRGNVEKAAHMGNTKAQYTFAKMWFDNGNYTLALQYACKLDRRETKTLMLLGNIYAALKMPAKAYENFKEAGKKSVHVDAFWRICELYIETGHLENALKCNKRAVKVDGLWGKAKHVRRIAECYRDGVGVSKDAEESLVWFKRLCEFGDADAHFHVADTFGQRGDAPEAYRKIVAASKKGHATASNMLVEINHFVTQLFSHKRKRE